MFLLALHSGTHRIDDRHAFELWSAALGAAYVGRILCVRVSRVRRQIYRNVQLGGFGGRVWWRWNRYLHAPLHALAIVSTHGARTHGFLSHRRHTRSDHGNGALLQESVTDYSPSPFRCVPTRNRHGVRRQQRAFSLRSRTPLREERREYVDAMGTTRVTAKWATSFSSCSQSDTRDALCEIS